MKTVLVTGGHGMLGRPVAREFERLGWRTIAPGRGELDVTDREAVLRALGSARPALVVHCAAYTDVDGCEREPERAFRVNGVGTKHVALACNEIDAHLIHISSDFVFDGTKGAPYIECDAPNPISTYGRSKLWGEMSASLARRSTIVRTQWLFGAGGRNFVDTILRAARGGKELRVVDDQVGCPTFCPHLAREIGRIAVSGTRGIYHVSSRGECSWYAFARAILDRAGLREVPASPITSKELARPAPRPAYSVLRNLHLELTIGDEMPSWEEGLSAYLEGMG